MKKQYGLLYILSCTILFFSTLGMKRQSDQPIPQSKQTTQSYIGQKVKNGELSKGESVRWNDRKIALNLRGKNLISLEGLENLLPKDSWHLITQIDISNNLFTEIPKEILEIISSTLSLTTLNASFNKLETLPDNFLSSKTGLSILMLEHNNLKKLPINFLNNCQKLVTILLSNNQLTELPQTFLSHHPLLRIVELRNNNLQTLPWGFGVSSDDLVSLDLYNNPILSTLQQNSFKITGSSLPNFLLDAIKGTHKQNKPTTLPPSKKENDEGYDTEALSDID